MEANNVQSSDTFKYEDVQKINFLTHTIEAGEKKELGHAISYRFSRNSLTFYPRFSTILAGYSKNPHIRNWIFRFRLFEPFVPEQ